MLKVLLITIVLMAFVFLLLGIQTFFTKKKKFPETEIGHNKNMAKLGISCAKHSEYQCRAEVTGKPSDNMGCGCSCG